MIMKKSVLIGVIGVLILVVLIICFIGQIMAIAPVFGNQGLNDYCDSNKLCKSCLYCNIDSSMCRPIADKTRVATGCDNGYKDGVVDKSGNFWCVKGVCEKTISCTKDSQCGEDINEFSCWVNALKTTTHNFCNTKIGLCDYTSNTVISDNCESQKKVCVKSDKSAFCINCVNSEDCGKTSVSDELCSSDFREIIYYMVLPICTDGGKANSQCSFKTTQGRTEDCFSKGQICSYFSKGENSPLVPQCVDTPPGYWMKIGCSIPLIKNLIAMCSSQTSDSSASSVTETLTESESSSSEACSSVCTLATTQSPSQSQSPGTGPIDIKDLPPVEDEELPYPPYSTEEEDFALPPVRIVVAPRKKGLMEKCVIYANGKSDCDECLVCEDYGLRGITFNYINTQVFDAQVGGSIQKDPFTPTSKITVIGAGKCFLGYQGQKCIKDGNPGVCKINIGASRTDMSRTGYNCITNCRQNADCPPTFFGRVCGIYGWLTFGEVYPWNINFLYDVKIKYKCENKKCIPDSVNSPVTIRKDCKSLCSKHNPTMKKDSGDVYHYTYFFGRPTHQWEQDC